jgi:hypothetical protein
VNTNKLLADCLYEKCGNDGAVYAAGECEENLFIAYLLTNESDLLRNESIGKLGGGDTRHGFGSFVEIHFDSSELF